MMNAKQIEAEAHRLGRAGDRVGAIKKMRQVLGSLALAVAWGNKHYPKPPEPEPQTPFERFYHGGQRPADALDLAIADARERKLGEFEKALIEYRDQRAALVEAASDFVLQVQAYCTGETDEQPSCTEILTAILNAGGKMPGT